MKQSNQARQSPELVWREEQRTLMLCGEPVLYLSLTWPELQGAGLAARLLNSYYARLAGVCRRRWTRQTYFLACLELAACRERSQIFRPWTASLTGRATLLNDRMISLPMELRECRGDGRTLLARLGGAWRTTDASPVLLGELLPGRFWRGPLLEQVAAAAEEQRRAGACVLDTELERQLRRRFCPRQFSLSPQGLELFYAQCAIAPAAEGLPTFRLPLPVSAPQPEEQTQT